MTRITNEAWADAADDPDPNSDLGYDLQPLTVIHVEDNGEKYMFLPGTEEYLEDDEFIVASPGSVCLLNECR